MQNMLFLPSNTGKSGVRIRTSRLGGIEGGHSPNHMMANFFDSDEMRNNVGGQ